MRPPALPRPGRRFIIAAVHIMTTKSNQPTFGLSREFVAQIEKSFARYEAELLALNKEADESFERLQKAGCIPRGEDSNGLFKSDNNLVVGMAGEIGRLERGTFKFSPPASRRDLQNS
jgi:hypothetical protein